MEPEEYGQKHWISFPVYKLYSNCDLAIDSVLEE